jgi:hypothetical protein
MKKSIWTIPQGNEAGTQYDQMSQYADDFAAKGQELVAQYTQWCRRSGQKAEDTDPADLSVTGKPAVVIQQLAKEAVLLSLYRTVPKFSDESTFKAFEAAVEAVEATKLALDTCRKQALKQVQDTWSVSDPSYGADPIAVKSNLDVFRTRLTYDAQQLSIMTNKTDNLYNLAVEMQSDFVNINPECTIESASILGCFPSGLAMLSTMLIAWVMSLV